MTPAPTATPETLRLFIAIELDLADVLVALQARLQALDRERAIRWSAIESIHLTLKFLGETPAERESAIAAALREAAAGHAPFDLAVEGVGCFPNAHRPRIVWAGLGGDLAALRTLRGSVERLVSPLGFPTEPRPFSPHLTLGRARKEAPLAALGAFGSRVAALDVGRLAAWQVTAVSLMRSELRPSGAVYTMRSRAALTSA